MAALDPNDSSAQPTPPGEGVSSRGVLPGGGGSETASVAGLYGDCERLTGLLICLMTVFSPWAFGATQPWSIWTLNTAGYALGAILLLKRLLRWRTGFRPPRWGEEVPERGATGRFRPHTRIARCLTRSMAVLTFLLLAYCLVSALNARAEFEDGVQVFNDHYFIWLPHSYAESFTWSALWNYLALACFFWAARDWLLGKSSRERGEAPFDAPGMVSPALAPLPGRLTRLLWVLSINGALLAAVSILQRLDGTDRLLWLLQPRFGGADFHFGPFSYRGNGAQYFNLLWPVSLAFWWTLFRASHAARRADARIGGEPHLVLLPCVLVQAAAPVISSSHGGTVVAAVLAIGTLGIFLIGNWNLSAKMRAGMLAPFVLGIALASYLGWNQFETGFINAFQDDLGDRIEIYEHARQMSVDHPLFGTGPGTFPALYQLYRTSGTEDWAAYAHNDWLETVITFGWVGFGLALLALAHLFTHWWARDGIRCRWDLAAMIWLAMGGCLFHARFDFPFQVYSLLLLFLLLGCVSICVARE